MIGGLLLLALASTHGLWAARHLAVRGSDARAFDQVLVRAAREAAPLPALVERITPQNDNELYLKAVITDQQDLMFATVLFVLRMVVTVTLSLLGMVLLTAGSIEWEIRSE